MFVDPTGLKIKISSDLSGEERDIIVRNLDLLTDDSVYLNRNGYVNLIINENANEHKNGTNLISRLVSSEKTVTITIGQVNEFIREQQLITFNPYKTIYLPTMIPYDKYGRTESKAADHFIILGHELIHADRLFRGELQDWFTYHDFRKSDYTFVKEYVRQEELETVGPLDMEPRRNSGNITENDLRWEHHIPLRGGYLNL